MTDYQKLSLEVLVSIRAGRTQGQIAKKMELAPSKVSKWEKGHHDMDWSSFCRLCEVTKVDLANALKVAFSYSEKDIKNTKLLVQHFTANIKQTELSKALKISRPTISRWIQNKTEPSLVQIFAMMDFSSVDFPRFIHYLIPSYKQMESIAERIDHELYASKIYFQFPWMSIFLSAISLVEYRKNPSLKFLQSKTKISMAQLEETIEAALKAGLIQKKGNLLEADLYRINLRINSERKKRVVDYCYETASKAAQASIDNKSSRFSWKMFSLNKKAYPLMLQKYTEFFNELGTIIDNSQDDADGVYLFSVGIIDMDDVPEKS